jgi:hypothetical protein
MLVTVGSAEGAEGKRRLPPGKPAKVRNAQANGGIIVRVGLIGITGVVVPGALLFLPADEAPAGVSATSP